MQRAYHETPKIWSSFAIQSLVLGRFRMRGRIASLSSRCYHGVAMQFLLSTEVAISLLLSLLILLQHRASGLSATFGGAGATYVQRRGAEKVLFRFTIWLSVAFFAIAVLMMYTPLLR